MNVTTIVVEQRDGSYRVKYRYHDSDPFKTLKMDGEEWAPVNEKSLRKMWRDIQEKTQTDLQEALRILLCSDVPRVSNDALPEAENPVGWSRQLLREAMMGIPCAGQWYVNGELLSAGDFREVFPVNYHEEAMYIYTVPKYQLPREAGNQEATVSMEETQREQLSETSGIPCDALSVLAELLREGKEGTDAEVSDYPATYDVMEIMRELLETPQK